MALPKLEQRITVPTGGWDLILTDAGGGPANLTVAAGDYYLTSAADGGSASFLAQVKTTLELGAGATTYTVTIDDTAATANGKVTIVPSTGTCTIVWDGTGSPATSTTLRNTLGFTGNVSASASATSESQSPAIWLPNQVRLPQNPDVAATASSWGFQESDLIGTRSPTGVVTNTVFSRRPALTPLRFEFIIGYKMWKVHEVTTNESLQKFWEGWIDAGAPPWRYHSDRSSDTVYSEMDVDPSGGSFRPQIMVPAWVGAQSQWAVEFGVVYYTSPS